MPVEDRIDAVLAETAAGEIHVSMPQPFPEETDLTVTAVRRQKRLEDEREGYRIHCVASFMSQEEAREIRDKIEEWCADKQVRINQLAIQFCSNTSGEVW